jgi:predicted component of viral defense system (DUF524 family)
MVKTLALGESKFEEAQLTLDDLVKSFNETLGNQHAAVDVETHRMVKEGSISYFFIQRLIFRVDNNSSYKGKARRPRSVPLKKSSPG